MSREVPSGWRESNVAETCEILDYRRKPLNSEERSLRRGYFPYWGANGIVDYIDDWLFDEPLVLMAEDGGYFDEASERPICHRLDGKAWVNNHAHVIRTTAITRDWFYFWFVHRDITPHIKGGTRSKLNQKDLKHLPILVPPLHEQRRIAEILSSVDEAIAATRAVIEQTKMVKQAVLERLLTRGIGHTRFKQTEIGEFPEEWDVARIDEIGEVVVGRQRSPAFVAGENVPYLRVANVFDNFIDTSDVLQMKFTEKEIERYLLKIGDILLNEGQSLHLVGRNARYQGIPSFCCFQNTLIRFRAGESTDSEYAFALVQFLFAQGRFSEIATQTTSVAHLGSSRFAALVVPVPSAREQREIGALHNSILETEARQNAQLDQLLSTKTALMSDLLTGRKRVTDALPLAAE